MATLSDRLARIVEALPLHAGTRVVEIGCGPGAAACAVADRVGPTGHVLAVDRSAKAIEQVRRAAADLIAAGRLSSRRDGCSSTGAIPCESSRSLMRRGRRRILPA